MIFLRMTLATFLSTGGGWSRILRHMFLTATLGTVWRMAWPAHAPVDPAWLRGWITMTAISILVHETGRQTSAPRAACLDQYRLHSGTLLPWLLGTWLGLWILFMAPCVLVLHLMVGLPVFPDILAGSTGLLSAIMVNTCSTPPDDARWPALLVSIPMMVPVVLVSLHPVPARHVVTLPFLEAVGLSPQGHVLLALACIILPVQFLVGHTVLVRSLSFPVILLED
jgi:hypothetical protein